ncbi:hypothetical protein GOHSU_28_00380 [Gordonia hirsuta DSM 44140 = NBRC 16056]|uniref:DUF2249 domain-containing protein n=1 Tax=Gordonia hirsuta DSM 44140 = NBRC 16056 TaxID=1121927 RepID=L7LD83_9ACTN|nr:DUF2249 domain-containing protein [Gordonia hirsuta]GAC57983.1 hypothetical protein GOHSU_28_00380 [Gordonia hirsuta DSM 44140 = NBRC 16056]
MPDVTIDVREIPKPQRHPKIFGLFDGLDVGEALILVNDHDPIPLHHQFDDRNPGGFEWEYLVREPGDYQIRISKLLATPAPRRIGNSADAVAGGEAGVAWKLDLPTRDLDSNLITLAPGGGIGEHTGAEVDVLIHILDGSGTLGTQAGPIEVTVGDLLWLPKGSQRSFTAGDAGLSYLTVHTHREPTLTITPR